MSLAAPFPWFGGKRKIAGEIWLRFGNVANYVDPFAGSLAVPLARPHAAKVETFNDADGLLVNFWRATVANPEAVARWCDWPVSEADLHPRHVHLLAKRDELAEKLQGDPDYFDAKLAGWWVWGQCAWIGTGWCSGKGPWTIEDGRLLKACRGGVWSQLPRLSKARGINRQLPHLAGSGSSGIHKQGIDVLATFEQIRARLRRARITCGDWRRVLTPSVTWRHGLTGILLDPPYAGEQVEYAAGGNAAPAVEVWCKEHGARPDLRIALCGLEGDYALPGWSIHRWKAQGGYGNQGTRGYRHAETIWFSPACQQHEQLSLPAWAPDPPKQESIPEIKCK